MNCRNTYLLKQEPKDLLIKENEIVGLQIEFV